MQRRRDRRPYEQEERPFDMEGWKPVTEVGKRVKAHEITSIEQIFHEGRKIEEKGIVEALLPGLKSEVIEIMNVQRMTKNNRKAKFRVTAVVGDGNGHVGVAAGKDVEVKAAIETAMTNAKKNIMPVIFGCGSWQCQCGNPHSFPIVIKGKCGSVEVTLKPAPKGLGIVASDPVKKLLTLVGVKDLWSFSRGRTRSKYNTIMAAYRAMESINKMKNVSALKIKATA